MSTDAPLMDMAYWLSMAAAEIEAVYPNASDDAKLAAVIALNQMRNLGDSLKRIEKSIDNITWSDRNPA